MGGMLALSAQHPKHINRARIKRSNGHFACVLVCAVAATGGGYPEDVPTFHDEALQCLEKGKEGGREGGVTLSVRSRPSEGATHRMCPPSTMRPCSA